MAKFYLVSAQFVIEFKDESKDVLDTTYSAIYSADRYFLGTQRALTNLLDYTTDSFFKTAEINFDDVKSLDRSLIAISFLGEMKPEEFVNQTEAIYNKMNGTKEVVKPQEANQQELN